jgi:hypothetical protein
MGSIFPRLLSQLEIGLHALAEPEWEEELMSIWVFSFSFKNGEHFEGVKNLKQGVSCKTLRRKILLR